MRGLGSCPGFAGMTMTFTLHTWTVVKLSFGQGLLVPSTFARATNHSSDASNCASQGETSSNTASLGSGICQLEVAVTQPNPALTLNKQISQMLLNNQITHNIQVVFGA